MKKTIYKIHKWSGVTIGIVLLLLAISGVAISFREELLPLTYPELFEISPGVARLPVSELYAKTNHNITNLYSSGSSDEAWLFLYKKEEAQFPFMMTVNPYTGEIIGEMSMIKNFFAVMLFLHANLFIGKIGSYFIGISGLMLFLFVFSGIYLWVPKSKVLPKLKRTISFKRLQLQHHSLGLIFAIPLIISGLTGFLTVFDMSYYIFQPIRNEKPRVEELELKGNCSREQQMQVLKKVPLQYQENLISIHFCTQKSNLMKVSYGLKNNDFLDGYGRVIIDPQSGSILQRFDSSKDPSSWNIKRLFIYPLHTGEYFGFFGRIINFITGIAMIGLCVTGFLLFRKRLTGRRKIDKTELEYSYFHTSDKARFE